MERYLLEEQASQEAKERLKKVMEEKKKGN